MRFFKTFLAVFAITAIVLLFSGCSEKKPGFSDAPPVTSTAPQQGPAQQHGAPYGEGTNTALHVPDAEMTAYIDADRGSDFVAHGTFRLPGTNPEGQYVTLYRFVFVVGATGETQRALRESVGKSVKLYGRYDSAGRNVFAVTGIEGSPVPVPPAREWVGWGVFTSQENGKVFSLSEDGALTDWVEALSRIATEDLGLPYSGAESGITAFIENMKVTNNFERARTRLAGKLFSSPLIYENEEALNDLRNLVSKSGFVTAARTAADMDYLVQRADVSEDNVERFMDAAKGASGSEGPHEEAPATIFGRVFRTKYGTFISGVEGDSFSEWMTFFRSGSGPGVTWELAGSVPEELLSNEKEIYCWFAGVRVQDPLTGKWYFSISSVLTEAQYESLLAVAKNLV